MRHSLLTAALVAGSLLAAGPRGAIARHRHLRVPGPGTGGRQRRVRRAPQHVGRARRHRRLAGSRAAPPASGTASNRVDRARRRDARRRPGLPVRQRRHAAATPGSRRRRPDLQHRLHRLRVGQPVRHPRRVDAAGRGRSTASARRPARAARAPAITTADGQRRPLVRAGRRTPDTDDNAADFAGPTRRRPAEPRARPTAGRPTTRPTVASTDPAERRDRRAPRRRRSPSPSPSPSRRRTTRSRSTLRRHGGRARRHARRRGRPTRSTRQRTLPAGRELHARGRRRPLQRRRHRSTRRTRGSDHTIALHDRRRRGPADPRHPGRRAPLAVRGRRSSPACPAW